MQCARCVAPHEVRLVESDDPVVQPNEVLIAVRAVSICPSDHHIFREGHSSGVYPDHPMVLGHEFSGVVAALGAEAKAPPVGTRVAVEPAWHCGTCDLCRRGLTNICRNVIFPSYPNRDGALADLIACPDFAIFPMPEGLGFPEAAFSEPVGVAVHAERLAGIQRGDIVAILGAGVIGVSLLEIALLRGAASVYVVEPREARRRFPASHGATKVYAHARQLIEEIGGTPDGANVVFEATTGPSALPQALEICEPAGRVVTIGIPHENHAVLEPSTPRRKELTVHFARRSRDCLADALQLVGDRRIHASEWSYREFPLAETQAAFELSIDPPDDVMRSVVRVGE